MILSTSLPRNTASSTKHAARHLIRGGPADVLYIHSCTRLGKITTTQDVLREGNIEYSKKAPGDRWFDGYNFERVIVFDEFASAIPLHQFNAICDPPAPSLKSKALSCPTCHPLHHPIQPSPRRPVPPCPDRKTHGISGLSATRF